jgi:hypothetical protein
MIPPTRRRSFSEQLRVGLHSAGNGIRPHAPCPRHSTETTPRPFASAPAASEPPFEVENFRRGAQPAPQQGLRRQQRDVMTGGAIDLHEVAEPEILDPRRVGGAAYLRPPCS